jgi:hypothetical protein
VLGRGQSYDSRCEAGNEEYEVDGIVVVGDDDGDGEGSVSSE